MALNKQFNYKRILLALGFLLLNFVCIASPVVNLDDNSNTDLISLQSGYGLSNVEMEPIPITAYSYKNGTLQVTAVATFTEPCTYLKNKAQHFVAGPVVSRNSLRLIPEPGYYSLLFIYSLF